MSNIVNSKKGYQIMSDLPTIDDSEEFIERKEETEDFVERKDNIENNEEYNESEYNESELNELILPIEEKINKENDKKDVKKEWPEIDITNVTQDISLYESGNTWQNCKDYYNMDFYDALLNLYMTGDIIDISKVKEYRFNTENYIETTNYERGKFTINDTQYTTLIAGDIITFETDHFDFGIFVTEVKVGNNILSKINTSIYEQPERSFIFSGNDNVVFSTVKDTLGNCYVIKKRINYDQDIHKMTKDMITFLNLKKTLEPTNTSIYDPEVINNNNSDYSSSYYYDTIFNENRLFYSQYGLDYGDCYKSIKGTNNVVIPSESEVAKKGTETIVQPFNCVIKGFFSVHRSKDIEEEATLQSMNFEIYFENTIKSDLNTSEQIKKVIEINFLECTEEEVNGEKKYYVYLKDDSTYSSCFFSGGGFYNTNQYNSSDSSTSNYKFELKNGLSGFHIYSPYFFTDQPKPLTKKRVINDKSNQSVYIEDYKNDRLELLKSIKSTHPNDNNNKGCTIV